MACPSLRTSSWSSTVSLVLIKTVSSTLFWLLLGVRLSCSYYWILPFFCVLGLFQHTAAVLFYACPKTWVTRKKSYPSRCLSTIFFHYFSHKITFFLALVNFPKGTGTYSLFIWKLKPHYKLNTAGQTWAPLHSVFSHSFSGTYTADARLVAGLWVLTAVSHKTCSPFPVLPMASHNDSWLLRFGVFFLTCQVLQVVGFGKE